jgi:hypothetical protein
MDNLYEYLVRLGYTDDKIKKLLDTSSYKGRTEEEIRKKLNGMQDFFEKRRFNPEEIKKVLRNSILYDIEHLEGVYKCFADYGYMSEEIDKIIINSSKCIPSDIEKLRKKLFVLEHINVYYDVVVNEPNILIQSAELTYARYCYLSQIGHYPIGLSSLVAEEGNFYRNYGIKKEELLKKYPLSNLIEGKHVR